MPSQSSSQNLIELPATVEQPPVGGLGKRIVDICLASVAILFLLPLMFLCALTILAVSHNKVLFRHRRVGLHGKSFNCLKFQTMVGDGDRVFRDYLAAHPKAQAEWESTCKLRHDPRVTAFGKVLRKTSVDELPQLINVLKGDMSIVGPRPVVEQELTRYGERRDAYLLCRPGITGLWQVTGRSNTSYPKRTVCDAYYAKHWSFALDARIILRTVPVIFDSGRAY
jgi:exopolysaccharide production protein ExoY